MSTTELPAAAQAFDAIANVFDTRFTPWLSVAAQRRAVRHILEEAFPSGARLIEIGGGTGEDALWLVERGRTVLMTDASPAMTRIAATKLGDRTGARTETVPAEELEAFALDPDRKDNALFDGLYSNFAGLNCVGDLAPVARGMARLVRPGGQAVLVMFGTACPGEVIVECLRGRPRSALRRLARGDVPARLGGHAFTVRYHRGAEIDRAMAPWFMPAGRQAIGLFVPPSAAEPWISRHPRLLALLEALDDRFARRLALLGDHVLYRYVRTDALVESG